MAHFRRSGQTRAALFKCVRHLKLELATRIGIILSWAVSVTVPETHNQIAIAQHFAGGCVSAKMHKRDTSRALVYKRKCRYNEKLQWRPIKIKTSNGRSYGEDIHLESTFTVAYLRTFQAIYLQLSLMTLAVGRSQQDLIGDISLTL